MWLVQSEGGEERGRETWSERKWGWIVQGLGRTWLFSQRNMGDTVGL